MEESGGTSGRREDAAPPWRPSEATAFGRFAAAAASSEASPSASANGATARVSSLHGVKRKPFVARLTAGIIQTYLQCDPEFKYSEVLNPKRFLTSPSTPAHNDGLDNANWDLILYVNLELVNKMSNRRFIVKEMLGQGTFGQVVKCWDTETNDYVAVKVIKNQPAFYHQAIMEVSLLRTLNQKFDPDDQHNIVRMLDYLSFQNHLCIAFEMLGQNLYELLKRNHLRGLKLKYVQAFSKQILDAMVVMREAGIIHCDLKPENILLAPSVATAAAVKVIDFGSACLEGKTVYSYIQSRYYRSPEVLLGYPYTTAIDMWSFGCIVAELFLGLPLFPGASEYDVLQRMMKILGGQPPDELLRGAKNTIRFFKHAGSIYPGNEAPTGLSSAYRILSEEEVEVRDSKRPKMGKWYFPHLKLDKLICTYPWNNSELTETEKTDRLGLVDFLKGLLEFDPNKRWSPLQALYHPFITGESFTGPYEPVPETARIPVARAAAIDHNPGGGHWLHSGLSPQVGSVNRYLPVNNAYPPKPSGGSRLPRATIPAECSPGLGELVILVGRVPGREEDHIVAVAKQHELQTPKPDHCGQRDRAFGVSHPGKNGGKATLARSGLLPGAPTVGVRSRGGPKPTSKCCVSLSWMVMQGEHTGVYPGSGGRRPYVQRGERVLYFLAPRCLCRGYKLAREGGEPKSQREEKEYKDDCLRC